VSPTEEFDKKKALLIILGASECFNNEKYKNVPMQQARASVEQIKGYFETKLELREEQIKNLFDSNANNDKQLSEIKNFLHSNEPNRLNSDVFVYAVGHGECNSNDLRLFIKNSSDNHETAISIKQLFDILHDESRGKRHYAILDMCYASTVRTIIPDMPYGTVCFCCANKKDEKSCNFQTENTHLAFTELTLFTGALLEILKNGRNDLPEFLSCNEINSLLSDHLIHQNKGDLEPQYHVIGRKQSIISNLRIFPNPAYVKEKINPKLLYPLSIAEELLPIKWHITTSNKGGVGKTLLSMMLLAAHCSAFEEDVKLPLVLDLNGVNTDLKRLLVTEELLEKDDKGQVKYINLQDEKICIVKVNQKDHSFFLGWLNDDPFRMLNTQAFFKLLMIIKGEGIKKIRDKFGKDFTIHTVIIDTNYHFCNIFSDNDEDYQYLKNFLWERDTFFIWFIWVYGQIRNLARKKIGSIPSAPIDSRMGKVAACVEKYLTSDEKGNLFSKSSPFFHVINPMGIVEKKMQNKDETKEIEKQNFIVRWFSEQIKKSGDEQPELDKLLSGEPISELTAITSLKLSKDEFPFVRMQGLMLSAVKKIEVSNTSTVVNRIERDIIKALLESLRGILEKNGRPKNLRPISIYQEMLDSYQNLENIYLADLVKLGVYQEFKKILDEI